MNLLTDFGTIAKFLRHPLVLVGFVLMLVFSIHDKLLEKGIIPTLSAEQGGVVVQLMLKYGFQLGMACAVLAFIWQIYQTYADTSLKKKTTLKKTPRK
jgi:hypothetical protein